MILLLQKPVNCPGVVESSQLGFESSFYHSCVIAHNLPNLSEPQTFVCKMGIVIPVLDGCEEHKVKLKLNNI